MKIQFPLKMLLAGVFAFVLFAAACGDNSTKTTPAAGGASPAATAATQPTKAADSNPGATLRFQFGTNAGSNYDPHTAPNPFVHVFLYPAYDRLVNLTPDGKFEPQLAESYQFTDGGKTLELKLRKNVVFHDGTPFNGDAVKANIERAKTNAKSTLKADATVIDSVVVLDPYTVQLKLNAPAASLVAILADRLGMMISPAAFNNPDLDLKPVGAGPFKVVSHDPGKVIVYEKFDKYWDPSAQRVARIELSMQLDPATRLRALRSGEIDATSLNPDQVKDAEGAGLKVLSDPGTGAFILYLNTARSEFGNPKVRQAVAMAIDRKGIADALHLGKCTATAQVFPAGYWPNDPNTKADFYKFDPAAARKLLTEAGFPNGFSFSAVVINVPFYSAQAEAIQGQLKEIGIKMDVQVIEPAQLLAKFAIEKSADSYFSTTGGFIDPARTVAQLYLPNSTLNPGGFTDAKIVELATKGLESTDQATRAPIYQQISKLAAEDTLHIPVCNGPALTGITGKVQGLRANLLGSYDLRYASIAK